MGAHLNVTAEAHLDTKAEAYLRTSGSRHHIRPVPDNLGLRRSLEVQAAIRSRRWLTTSIARRFPLESSTVVHC